MLLVISGFPGAFLAAFFSGSLLIEQIFSLDGLGYLTFSLANFLSPPLVTRVYPYIPFGTAFLGEGALFLWLIIKSVNAERWQEQAAAGK